MSSPFELVDEDDLRGESRLKVQVESLYVYYGKKQALRDINLNIFSHAVTAVIGPSGCGKTTLLRSLNRMNDMISKTRIEGRIEMDGEDIYRSGVDVSALRRRVGMIFQSPTPFRKSIFENVAFGLRIHGEKENHIIYQNVEEALRQASLWDEVKDRLDEPAMILSEGQKQRLCIARALAVEPEVLLMDEPTSALDPIATRRMEELIFSLKSTYTIVLVTQNMQQAARISDYTAFLYLGELVEFGETNEIFTSPGVKETEDYVTGRFG